MVIYKKNNKRGCLVQLFLLFYNCDFESKSGLLNNFHQNLKRFYIDLLSSPFLYKNSHSTIIIVEPKIEKKPQKYNFSGAGLPLLIVWLAASIVQASGLFYFF